MKKSELNKLTAEIIQKDSEVYKDHLLDILESHKKCVREGRVHNSIIMGLCSMQTLAIIYMVMEIVK